MYNFRNSLKCPASYIRTLGNLLPIIEPQLPGFESMLNKIKKTFKNTHFLGPFVYFLNRFGYKLIWNNEEKYRNTHYQTLFLQVLFFYIDLHFINLNFLKIFLSCYLLLKKFFTFALQNFCKLFWYTLTCWLKEKCNYVWHLVSLYDIVIWIEKIVRHYIANMKLG